MTIQGTDFLHLFIVEPAVSKKNIVKLPCIWKQKVVPKHWYVHTRPNVYISKTTGIFTTGTVTALHVTREEVLLLKSGANGQNYPSCNLSCAGVVSVVMISLCK